MKKKKLNILISSIGGLFIYDVVESLRKSGNQAKYTNVKN